MSQFSQTDIKEFDDIIKKRMNDVKKIQLKVLEPSGDEKAAINKIVYDFIKEKKRKIYGGFAQNLLIKDKNKDEAFYSDSEYPDIDIYSPDPINDIIELCNRIYDKNYGPVVGQEAQHKETYKLFVNYEEYCDISYVPKNVYNKMPFTTINGFTVIQPILAYIDFLRAFNDPLTSWEIKLEKKFGRYNTLLKYYPLPNITKDINIKSSNDSTLNDLIYTINDYLIDKDTIIAIGTYAYNYYRNYNNDKTINIPYFEAVSTNFRHDSLDLIEKLKKISDKIVVEEHYHFFQYFGNSAYIYYDTVLIAIIFTTYDKCVPYHNVPALIFNGNKVEKKTGNINIGSFSIIIQYALSSIIQSRTNDDKETADLYYSIISHMNVTRNKYKEKNKKTVYDADIYSDFITECKGTTVSAKREGLLRMADKYERNIKQFRYKPADKIIKTPLKVVFSNSSGNKIVNPKNLRLSEKPLEENIDETEIINEEKNQERDRPDFFYE